MCLAGLTLTTDTSDVLGSESIAEDRFHIGELMERRTWCRLSLDYQPYCWVIGSSGAAEPHSQRHAPSVGTNP